MTPTVNHQRRHRQKFINGFLLFSKVFNTRLTNTAMWLSPKNSEAFKETREFKYSKQKKQKRNGEEIVLEA